MTRKHGKKDANHDEIKEIFLLAGFSATDTSDLGNGFPDIEIGMDRLSHCIEVKNGNAKLTKDENYWHNEYWQGSAAVIRNESQAQEFIKYHRRTAEWLKKMPNDWYEGIDLDFLRG